MLIYIVVYTYILVYVQHTQGAQIRISFTCKKHRTCLYLVSIVQMAPTETEMADI